jgi:cytochrome c2
MKNTLLVVCALVGGLCVCTLASGRVGQIQSLPGSVSRGEQVLREKGCLDCHSLKGSGGKRAPDFAALSEDADTPARLATAIWNHGPRMWADYETVGRTIPSLSQNDVADVFSYFFATLYFEPHGSASRGRSVFINKGCINCHSEVLNAQALDPFLSRWTQLRDPTSWAERFWSHANEMDAATALRGINWPELSARDIADLMMFFSSLPGAPSEGPAFSIGDPLTGKAIFERSCESCHSLGAGDKSRIDLLKRSRQTSVAGYVAAMWNHAPKMRRRGGSVPKLAPGEMDDVIGYLFLEQYFYEQGDVARGRRVYESKGCAGCHEGRRASGAPDLAGTVQRYTPVTMAAAVWRHGPTMAERLRQEGRVWPQLQRSEMTDLLTYLNSLLRTQIAQ